MDRQMDRQTVSPMTGSNDDESEDPSPAGRRLPVCQSASVLRRSFGWTRALCLCLSVPLCPGVIGDRHVSCHDFVSMSLKGSQADRRTTHRKVQRRYATDIVDIIYCASHAYRRRPPLFGYLQAR
jgi:hypothetical protein